MNHIQRGVLNLIRSAITGEVLELPDDFSLDDAFEFCRKRNIVSLLYTGAVRCNISKQDPVMLKMLQYYFKYMVRSEKQMADLTRLFKAFDDAAIDYLPIKGAHMKNLYPAPELRVMGDADILIRLEQYEQIVPILKELGFQFKLHYHHHFVWYTDHLYLELHQSLVPSYNKDYYKYFLEGWQLASLDSGTRYKFRSPEDEFIYLFTHFTKHYRSSGIGCRHVIDLWVFRRNYPNMDEKYLMSMFKQLDMDEFYQNILKLIQVWFEDAKSDEKSSFISDFIFESGNWGSMSNHTLSTSVRNKQSIKFPRLYRLYKLMTHIFPSRDIMEEKFKILKKFPILLPLFYLVRGVDILLHRPKSISRAFSHIAYSTPDKVNSYEQALSYVGLRFNNNKE